MSTTWYGGTVVTRDGATLEIEPDRHLTQGCEWVAIYRVRGGRRDHVADLGPDEADEFGVAAGRSAHVVRRRSLLWGWFPRGL